MRRVMIVVVFALMLAGGGVVGFFQTFSSFLEYDDEGFVMISVQSFLDGQPLYDKTYSQYGPFYHLYKAALHQLTGMPVGHDSVRLMLIGAWLLTALCCSLFSYRVTGSLLLAAAVYLFVFRDLWLHTNEPGHPQELCALLLALGVNLASFANSAARYRWVLPAMGAVAAALLLTKINAGVYFGLALAGTCVSLAESRWLRRAATALLIAVAIVLPIRLTWSHLNEGFVQCYVLLAITSSVAALAVAACRNRRELRRNDLGLAFLCFAVTALVIFGITLALGTSAAGFWEGVVLGPLRTGWTFALLGLVPTIAAIPAIFAAAAAVGVCVIASGKIQLSQRMAAAFTALGSEMRFLLVVGAISVFTAFWGTPGDFLAFGGPWIWLAIADPSRQPTSGDAFGRTMVVLTATFMVLYVYPVAGGQWSNATFLLIPATANCAHDLWLRWQSSRLRLPAKVVAVAALIAYVVIAIQWWTSARSFAATYRDRTPLNLPGAHWVRASEDEAAILRSVSINLRDHCDTFYSAPGFNSFYFWSGLKPPTGFNAGHWMTLLDDQQKQATIDQLEQHPRAWLVYHPRLFATWLIGDNQWRTDDPLVRYCLAHYEPVVRVGEYNLCLPRGEKRPVLTEAANVSPLPRDMAQRSELGLPKDASPNVIVELRLAPDAGALPGLARVIIVNAADRKVLADSGDESNHGMKVVDADLRPVKLPLPAGWNEDRQFGRLHLIPYQTWLPPKDYDYSKVLVGLVDEQGDAFCWLPLAIPLGPTAQ